MLKLFIVTFILGSLKKEVPSKEPNNGSEINKLNHP